MSNKKSKNVKVGNADDYFCEANMHFASLLHVINGVVKSVSSFVLFKCLAA